MASDDGGTLSEEQWEFVDGELLVTNVPFFGEEETPNPTGTETDSQSAEDAGSAARLERELKFNSSDGQPLVNPVFDVAAAEGGDEALIAVHQRYLVIETLFRKLKEETNRLSDKVPRVEGGLDGRVTGLRQRINDLRRIPQVERESGDVDNLHELASELERDLLARHRNVSQVKRYLTDLEKVQQEIEILRELADDLKMHPRFPLLEETQEARAIYENLKAVEKAVIDHRVLSRTMSDVEQLRNSMTPLHREILDFESRLDELENLFGIHEAMADRIQSIDEEFLKQSENVPTTHEMLSGERVSMASDLEDIMASFEAAPPTIDGNCRVQAAALEDFCEVLADFESKLVQFASQLTQWSNVEVLARHLDDLLGEIDRWFVDNADLVDPSDLDDAATFQRFQNEFAELQSESEQTKNQTDLSPIEQCDEIECCIGSLFCLQDDLEDFCDNYQQQSPGLDADGEDSLLIRKVKEERRRVHEAIRAAVANCNELAEIDREALDGQHLREHDDAVAAAQTALKNLDRERTRLINKHLQTTELEARQAESAEQIANSIDAATRELRELRDDRLPVNEQDNELFDVSVLEQLYENCKQSVEVARRTVRLKQHPEQETAMQIDEDQYEYLSLQLVIAREHLNKSQFRDSYDRVDAIRRELADFKHLNAGLLVGEYDRDPINRGMTQVSSLADEPSVYAGYTVYLNLRTTVRNDITLLKAVNADYCVFEQRYRDIAAEDPQDPDQEADRKILALQHDVDVACNTVRNSEDLRGSRARLDSGVSAARDAMAGLYQTNWRGQTKTKKGNKVPIKPIPVEFVQEIDQRIATLQIMMASGRFRSCTRMRSLCYGNSSDGRRTGEDLRMVLRCGNQAEGM